MAGIDIGRAQSGYCQRTSTTNFLADVPVSLHHRTDCCSRDVQRRHHCQNVRGAKGREGLFNHRKVLLWHAQTSPPPLPPSLPPSLVPFPGSLLWFPSLLLCTPSKGGKRRRGMENNFFKRGRRETTRLIGKDSAGLSSSTDPGIR